MDSLSVFYYLFYNMPRNLSARTINIVLLVKEFPSIIN
jgi:hypothetical protein